MPDLDPAAVASIWIGIVTELAVPVLAPKVNGLLGGLNVVPLFPRVQPVGYPVVGKMNPAGSLIVPIVNGMPPVLETTRYCVTGERVVVEPKSTVGSVVSLLSRMTPLGVAPGNGALA